MGTYIDSAELYYSEIFPNGIYAHFRDDGVALPIADSFSKTQTTSVVKNILSHELFYCKKIFLSSDEQKKIITSEILNPSSTLTSWPVDLVAIGDDTGNTDSYESLNLRHLYCDEYHSISVSQPNYILLFPYDKKDSSGRGGYAYYIPLDNWMKSVPLGQRNYKNDKIRKICRGICESIARFNREGYVYFDFHLSRFMVLPDLGVVPEYTNLLINKALGKKKNAKVLTAEYGNIPLEFVLPYAYFVDNNMKAAWESDNGNLFAMPAQNYSLAAMLFFLMFNRKPYEGQRLMQNQDDETDQVGHYAYLKNLYLQEENIDFIFDNTHDNPNLIIDDYADFFSNDIKLWNECDKEIKEMFIKSLKRKSAMKDQYVLAPNASSWVNLFEKLGWGN